MSAATAKASAVCQPFRAWSPGDTSACSISIICQRCHRCLIHCICPPAELRAPDPAKLSAAARKSFVARPVIGRRRSSPPTKPSPDDMRIEVIAVSEVIETLQEEVERLKRELRNAREVAEFAMAQVVVKPEASDAR